jgi:hypothetical protein
LREPPLASPPTLIKVTGVNKSGVMIQPKDIASNEDSELATGTAVRRAAVVETPTASARPASAWAAYWLHSYRRLDHRSDRAGCECPIPRRGRVWAVHKKVSPMVRANATRIVFARNTVSEALPYAAAAGDAPRGVRSIWLFSAGQMVVRFRSLVFIVLFAIEISFGCVMFCCFLEPYGPRCRIRGGSRETGLSTIGSMCVLLIVPN